MTGEDGSGGAGRAPAAPRAADPYDGDPAWLLPEGHGDWLDAADRRALAGLARDGTPRNTRRALARDMAYVAAWCAAATGGPLPWPAPAALMVKFVVQHVREGAMPPEAEAVLAEAGFKRNPGPHAQATVERRVSSWRRLHRLRGLEPPTDPAIAEALSLSRRAHRKLQPHRSPTPLLRDHLEPMIAACADAAASSDRATRVRGLRDRALLGLAFAGGGRRRSEVAALRLELVRREPAQQDGAGGVLPACSIALAGHKTDQSAADARRIWILGPPAEWLDDWLRELARQAIPLDAGPLFRRVARDGTIGEAQISDQAVNAIVKARAVETGIDPARVSAHGLRSGFVVQAELDGVPMALGMGQTLHRDPASWARYASSVSGATSPAGRVLDGRRRG